MVRTSRTLNENEPHSNIDHAHLDHDSAGVISWVRADAWAQSGSAGGRIAAASNFIVLLGGHRPHPHLYTDSL